MKKVLLTVVFIFIATASIRAQKSYYIFSAQRTKDFLQRYKEENYQDLDINGYTLDVKDNTIVGRNHDFDLTTYSGTARLIELTDLENKTQFNKEKAFKDSNTGIIFGFMTYHLYDIADDSVQIANRAKAKKLGFKVYRDFKRIDDAYYNELIVTKHGTVKLLNDIVVNINKGKGVSYINQLALTKKQYLDLYNQIDPLVKKLANITLQYQNGIISRNGLTVAKPIIASLKKLTSKLNAINIEKYKYDNEQYFFYHVNYESKYYSRTELSDMLDTASYALGEYY